MATVKDALNKLESHERECAIRYKNIEARLESGDKRFDKLESMMYDLEHKWSQMIFLKGKELEIFKKICWNTDNYSMFGFEAINDLLSMGGIVNVCHHKDAKAIDIDSSKDLEKVSQIL